MMQPAELPLRTADRVRDILGASLNPILARGVLRFALQRCELDEVMLNHQGVTPSFVGVLEEGVRRFCSDQAVQRRCMTQLRSLVGDQPPEEEQQRTRPVSLKTASTSQAAAVSIEIRAEYDIVKARSQARELARDLGFTATDQTKVATAVSEVSRNIYNYAGRGVVRLLPVEGLRTGVRIEANDQGPGIKDLDEILAGHYSSKTGLGLGLRGCKRLMDSFTVTSSPRTGTRVVMEKLL